MAQERPSSNLSSDELNRNLIGIQRRLPLEAVATPTIFATSIPLIYLSMVEYYGNDPKMFAAVLGFKLLVIASLALPAYGTQHYARKTHQDWGERKNILEEAKQRGLQIKGFIFKRINH